MQYAGGIPPNWLEIRRPKHLPDERLVEFGRGERYAILLAEELHVVLVVDEAKAYHEAQRRNVPVLRTLAVLDKAADRGLIDLAEAIARLGQQISACRRKFWTDFSITSLLANQLREHSATGHTSILSNQARIKVARVHERIRNLRLNFSHQLTHRLMQYPALCPESLSQRRKTPVDSR